MVMLLVMLFQSTHPRGVRPVADGLLTLKDVVSIHAPTRGATKEYVNMLVEDIVSIHAPTRGATTLIRWY